MLKLRHSGSRAALVPKRRRAANRRVRLKGKPLPSLREIAGKIASPMRKHARASMSLLLIGAAIAAPFGVGYLVTHAQHFAVKTVAFSQTEHVDAGRLEKRLQNVVGSNLFLVESAAIEQQLLREPWLKSVKIHRELPGTLRIDVEERHAAAAVALDAIYLVDASGTPFKRATAEEAAHLPIPIITGLSRDRFARRKSPLAAADPRRDGGEHRLVRKTIWQAAPRAGRSARRSADGRDALHDGWAGHSARAARR